MNRTAMWAIATKDIRAITASIQVWLPLLLVPVIVTVALPVAFVIVMQVADVAQLDSNGSLRSLLDGLSGTALGARLATLAGLRQQLVYVVVNYLFVPLFLLVPLMAASVVSASSFAAEKERGTLEALLFAPLDMVTLFTGKLLSAFLPAMVVSLLCFVLYGLAVNIAGWPLFGRLFFPESNWLVMMLWVIPMISLSAILVNVVISARVKGFQEAYQLGGLVVLPIIAVLIGQVTGVLLLSTGVMLLAGLALAVVNLLLLRWIAASFDRNRLFESQVR